MSDAVVVALIALVTQGLRTIEQVPERYRAEVQILVEEG